MNETTTSFEADIEKALAEHAEDVTRITTAIATEGDKAEDLVEIIYDVVSDIKSSLGSTAANQVSDADAEETIEAVEKWVTDNVSNAATERLVAAGIAFMGRDEFIRHIGIDANTYTVEIDEIQHHRRIYTIVASSEQEALEMAERGETSAEANGKFVGVIGRDNAEIIAEG